MKRKLLILIAAAGCFFLVSGPVLAHHGSSAYDMTTLTTVTGTVTDFELINPHSLISIKVKGENGKVEIWTAENDSAGALVRQGWTKDMLKAGDEISMTGYRTKNRANLMRLESVIMPNGQKITPQR
jgi:uncharacterized protein DUF6152